MVINVSDLHQMVETRTRHDCEQDVPCREHPQVQDAHLLLSLARPGAFRSPAFRLLRWRPLVTEAEAAEIQQAARIFQVPK